MGTPSEEVAKEVVRALGEKKLLLPDDGEKLGANIAAGAMKPEDWLLAAQKAVDKGVGQ
jgi:hypothetical protein